MKKIKNEKTRKNSKKIFKIIKTIAILIIFCAATYFLYNKLNTIKQSDINDYLYIAKDIEKIEKGFKNSKYQSKTLPQGFKTYQKNTKFLDQKAVFILSRKDNDKQFRNTIKFVISTNILKNENYDFKKSIDESTKRINEFINIEIIESLDNYKELTDNTPDSKISELLIKGKIAYVVNEYTNNNAYEICYYVENGNLLCDFSYCGENFNKNVITPDKLTDEDSKNSVVEDKEKLKHPDGSVG